MSALRDRTGERYGKFTVIERGPGAKSGASWVLRCDCGETRVATACSLNSYKGICGCERRELTAEELKVRQQRYNRARNPEKERASKRAWYWRNPERSRLLVAVSGERRRALKRSAPGSGVTKAQWGQICELFAGQCAYCLLSRATSMDHVAPIVSGGAHDIENAVPACRSCNSSKGAKSLLKWVMSGGGVIAPSC